MKTVNGLNEILNKVGFDCQITETMQGNMEMTLFLSAFISYIGNRSANMCDECISTPKDENGNTFTDLNNKISELCNLIEEQENKIEELETALEEQNENATDEDGNTFADLHDKIEDYTMKLDNIRDSIASVINNAEDIQSEVEWY